MHTAQMVYELDTSSHITGFYLEFLVWGKDLESDGGAGGCSRRPQFSR